MMNVALEITELSSEKSSHGNFQLNIANVDIPDTSITAIIGHNGCGKTTILEAILGLRSGIKRRVVIFGNESVNDDRLNFSDVGFAGQSQSFADGLSVREIIRLNNRLRLLDDTAFFDTADFEKQKFAALSSGQRRRVLIRHALDHCPELAILDEPDAGLDDDGLGHLITGLKKRTYAGKSTIVATHNSELLGASEYVIIIKKGNVAFQGDLATCKTEFIGSTIIEFAPPSSQMSAEIIKKLKTVKDVKHLCKTKEGRILASGGKTISQIIKGEPFKEMTGSTIERPTHPQDILTLIGQLS